MANSAAVAERATNELLSVPDWAINIELCNIINVDPGQAKDALKIIKKKLGNKNPKVQILALFVLDALSKYCGDLIFQQIVDEDILGEMVKIVMKKPDLNVREKILVLIDTWQATFAGIRGKFPQYYDAYNKLKSAGVEFPPRVGNNVPLFTPPPTRPLYESYFPCKEEIDVLAIKTDPSGLSLEEIKNAEGLADILTKMLDALDPNNSQAVKDELIVDLVDQCRVYQKRVIVLMNNNVDEGLLCRGFLLHDSLQRVLRKHDNITRGTTSEYSVAILEDSVARVALNHADEESDDDSSKLIQRSSKDMSQGLVTKQSKTPFSFSALLTRIYGPEKMEKPSIKSRLSTPHVPSHSSSDLINPASKSKCNHVDPTVKNQLHVGNIPPPPSRYNQRRQFFYQVVPTVKNHSAATENHSIKYTNTEQGKPQDSVYKYIIEIATVRAAQKAEVMRPS